jgi:hypothetical protein
MLIALHQFLRSGRPLLPELSFATIPSVGNRFTESGMKRKNRNACQPLCYQFFASCDSS